MYFPDLDSVKSYAISMTKNKDDKKYTGIIPNNENELMQARRELASYFREIWDDEIQALEIELAVTKKDYDKKMNNVIQRILFSK